LRKEKKRSISAGFETVYINVDKSGRTTTLDLISLDLISVTSCKCPVSAWGTIEMLGVCGEVCT
jgi:hypothetical protein